MTDLDRRELRLVIADDHAVVREGLLALLNTQHNLHVVAVCRTGTEAREAISSHKPDIAILDVRMPGISGLDLLAALREEEVPVRVILLTASITSEEADRAIRAGVDGLVLKDQAADELLNCIVAVGSGSRWLASTETLGQQAGDAPTTGPGADLTPRELEIATLVAAGLSNKEIARKLSLSEGTVKIHLHNVYVKLGVNNRTSLAARVLAQPNR